MRKCENSCQNCLVRGSTYVILHSDMFAVRSVHPVFCDMIFYTLSCHHPFILDFGFIFVTFHTGFYCKMDKMLLISNSEKCELKAHEKKMNKTFP